MERINLGEDYYLRAEPDNKKIRLIVFNGNAELTCRKTSLKEIFRFLESDEEILFKGRLRLLKDESEIIIFINKHNIAGKTAQQSLIDLLNINTNFTN